MAKDKSKANSKKKATPTPSNSSNLDILFAGPLLFAPSISAGNITSIEVYSPCNDHPVGAIFMPGQFFTDDDLDAPDCTHWPEPGKFTLIDPHSYAIELSQAEPTGGIPPFPAANIPDTNHKVKPGRKITGHWQVAVNVSGKLSRWSSHRLFNITDGIFLGSDAPTSAQVASLHRLSYTGVTAAEFCGLPTAPKEYLKENIAKGGTIIVIGEIPYQPTLQHERQAVSALAKLAGLDLHLVTVEPSTLKGNLMSHTRTCGLSTILTN